MPREPAKYLHDIARAAANVDEFVAGRTLESWRGDRLLQSAVERQFEIMGEAQGWAEQSGMHPHPPDSVPSDHDLQSWP